ncbi:hypothetical protein G9A89_015131 [Geosiphon pyriformis]|nr:hypothetical protein G9A89_015131 [Geosiphon pyriformis]
MLEEKPITAMYTDVKVNNQLGHQVDHVISARIITANRVTKTPIGKINDLSIEINGIIVPIYTHCKQIFNIPDGIEAVKKSVYQYIKNCINNYLFGNYNILKVRSNLYNNLVHYSQLETENLNIQSRYFIDFELETETSNKGKQKKQHSNITPTTPKTPKITAKHLQTPEQGTSTRLLLSLLKSPTQQQEPILTSTNIIDYLQENESNNSENLQNKETKSKQEETTENKEEMATAYIAKISEFTGKNNNTSPQEWLNKVQKAGDANGWNAARMLKAISYSLQRTAKEYYFTMSEESDFQQIALSESKVAAPKSNPSNNTILPAQIVQNTNLSDIFLFKFKANKSPFLLSNTAVNEQKAITAMYTEATIKGKPIQLILDSRFTESIITYQLIQQLNRNVNRPAQTVIVTADGIKKRPVGEIDNFPFTINGITISVKVLVMNISQYQVLKTQELKISYQEQYTIVPATCGTFNKQSEKAPVFEFEEKKEMPFTKTYMALGSIFNWAGETEQKIFEETRK